MKSLRGALLVLVTLHPVTTFAQGHEFYTFRALGEQAVSSVLEAAPDAYWITTYDGIARVDLANDSLFAIKPDDGVRGHGFTDIAQDRDGQLWITGRNVLVRFDGEKWYRVPLKKETDLLVGVDSDSEGNVWVAGGLGKFSPLVLKLSGQRATYFEVEDGLIQDWISALLVDHLNQVWTATEFGLNVFDGQQWATIENEGAGKLLSNITDLCLRGEQLWAVSSFGEVFQIDPESRTVREIRPMPPLEALYHIACLEDEVWVASKQSLARFRDKTWESISDFGLTSEDEVLDMSLSRDGRLLLGTTKGLVILDRD